MANPQKENGFIPISTEFWEAWLRTRVPGEVEQVFKFIIRKTWGFKKKTDQISSSQIMAATGLPRRAVEKAKKRLREYNMITTAKKGGSQIPLYGINKDYETWRIPPKKAHTTAKKGYKLPPKKRNTIDNIDNKTIDKNQPQAAASCKSLKDSPKVKEAMERILQDGFNIYEMINKVKANMRQPETWNFPEQVILKVCEAYFKEKDKINDPWPWFITVLKQESESWFAEQNITQAQIYKKDSGALSLAQILKGIGK